MTVEITLTLADVDATTFDLYSSTDSFGIPFETGVPVASLTVGYTTSLVPDGTTVIRVQNVSASCSNFIDLVLITTTTTTSTSSSSTTTTTSTSSSTTTTSSSSTTTTSTSSSTTTTTSSSTTITTTTTSAPPLTEIQLGHSEIMIEACALSPVGTYYINSASFVSATEIYTEPTGITPGQTGYYSDGTTWRQWLFSTQSFIDIGGC